MALISDFIFLLLFLPSLLTCTRYAQKGLFFTGVDLQHFDTTSTLLDLRDCIVVFLVWVSA